MAVITGNTAGNTLNGTTDADTINGLQGNDTIDAKTRPTAPGSGTDVVDGGVDFDTLVVNAASETQDVQLYSGLSPTFSVRSASGNFYVDAYNMEKIRFFGGSGNDTINTGEYVGTVDGGGGMDYWIANLGGTLANITFTLGSTGAITAAGITSIAGIERISLTTGIGNDVITGAAQGDSIVTGDGNDTINAKTRPTGGATDIVDGGADTDTLIVDASAETQSVSLASGSSPTFQVRSTSGNFHVDAYDMEIVKFTGGTGNDSIDTADHSGTVNGGGGIDRWYSDLSALSTAVTFTLGATTSIAAAGLTSITNIEAIGISTGSGADKITGGAQNDVIYSGFGNDTIDAKTRPTGSGGIDIVDGEGGIDTLIVDAGAETKAVQLFVGSSPSFSVRSDSTNFYVDAYSIEKIKFTGGSGNDQIATGDRGQTVAGGGGTDQWIADLSATSTGITFALGTTTAITAAGLTSITGIEGISLTTGGGNDKITGGAEADSIGTNAGNDVIDAKTRPVAGFTDVVDGGQGFDTLIVNGSAETKAMQFYNGSSPTFQVRSDSGNFYVDAYNMEAIQFTGGAGNDQINTGDRGQKIDGGGGNDFWSVNLSDVSDDITFVLGTTTAIAPAGLTSILNLEQMNFTAGSGDDTITGGAFGDVISGGIGADVLNAKTRQGIDTDVVHGNAGFDTLVVDVGAESQNVQVFAGTSPNFQVRSDSGNFYVDAYTTEKLIFTGGAGNDSVSGLNLADVLTGGNGNDTMSGLDGNDTMSGGIGADLLRGGRGADQMTGNTGADTFDYDRITESSTFTGQIDTVTDFSVGGDKLDLVDIDADNLGANGNQAFTFIGGAAFSGAKGELRSVSGMVEADVSGDGVADFRIMFSNGAILAAADIAL